MTTDEAVKKALRLAEVILPSSANKIEKAVLTAELARMQLINPDVVGTIWNPWLCPASLLPFLAHAISVDVWSDDWSEQQKRKVIAASPFVHRLKGTRGAIERALKAFDIDSHIIEWWEDDARRGTFRVEMLYYHGGPVFDTALQQFAIDSVIAAKPKSRIFTSRAVIKSASRFFVASYPVSNFMRVAQPLKFKPPKAEISAFLATVPIHFISSTAHPKG